MRRISALIPVMLLGASLAWGQSARPKEVIRAVRVDKSAPLQELVKNYVPVQRSGEIREIPLRQGPAPVEQPAFKIPMIDPALQDRQGNTPLSPAAILSNFDGASVSDNGFLLAPPDPNGDVGPNHYIQMVNLVTTIFDKSGTPLVGPVAGNVFWSGFGGPCETSNDGDPVVLYDPLADRWIVTQFAVTNPGQTPNSLCVACSQTPDPTGAYYRYEFPFGTTFPDYPKYGVWPDAYLFTTRNFSPFEMMAGAMERDQILSGQPAQIVLFSVSDALSSTDGSDIDGVLPVDIDGVAPPSGAPGIFIGQQDDGWTGAATDRLAMFSLSLDWNNIGNSTFSGPTYLPTDPFDYSVFSVPQPNGQGLDVLSFFMMHRAAVRNMGSYLAMVANHAVDVDGTNHAGIRWYELRSSDAGNTWSIFQQGTYAPDSEHRWMGSIAMDAGGNIALAYSVASSSTFPSLRYTGRFDGDPPGQMTLSENSIIAGTGSQSGTDRWGDYSMLAVDPSAEGSSTNSGTFWYTNEYIATTGTFNWRTRIAAFTLQALPGPNISVSPPSINFGQVPVGTTVGPTQVTISNIGDAALTVSGISNPGGDFSLSNLPGLPATISPQGTETFDVSFSPLASGVQTSSFNINSDAVNDAIVSVNLQGEGIIAPANDLCPSATPIACGQTMSGSTTLATFDNVGTCGTSNTAPGVWYTYVGTGDIVTASTCSAADYDTKISVFDGSCGTLDCIGGNDDASGCSGFTSKFTWASVPGVDYYILVHGFGSGTGNFDLTLTCVAPPSNDVCTNALAVQCGETVSGSTANAGVDGAPFCGTSNTAPGVWYSVIGTGYDMTATTCNAGTDYDTKLTVYTDGCGTLTCVAGNDDDFSCSFSGLRSTVDWTSVAGQEYLILVHGFGSATGNFEFSVTCAIPPEIAVSPTEFNFLVPLQGGASDVLTISNVGDPGADDLEWSLTKGDVMAAAERGKHTIVPMRANTSGNSEPSFRLTEESMHELYEAHLPAGLLAQLENMVALPATDKETFVANLFATAGEKQVFPYMYVIFENAMQIEESKELPETERAEKYGSQKHAGDSGSPLSPKAAGGPDAYGYDWIDSDEAGGPVFDWMDISGLGTEIISNGDWDASTFGGADDSYKEVTLPFTFSFYGVNHSAIKVGSNGYFTFGVDGTDFSNDPIPGPFDPNDIICPFWDDLSPADDGSRGHIYYYHDNANGRFIVQWTGVPRYLGSDPYTFQGILYADGSMLFQYLDMQGSVNSATIGIENVDGSIGLEVVYNTAYVHNNLAVLVVFEPPCPWLTVNPVSGTVPQGGSQPITLDVNAAGLPAGIYHCEVRIQSNAPNASVVTVPVTLEVGTYDIYAVNTRTGNVERVTYIDDADEYNPSFSNDGKKVTHDVRGGSAPYGHSIYVTDVRSGVSTLLEGAEGGNDASWSPDGRYVAFDRTPVGDLSVYLVPAAGGTPTLVRADAVDAEWSNNSDRLVFHDVTDGSLRTITLKGGSETDLGVSGFNPSWSPSGKMIAYSDGNNIFAIQVKESGEPQGSPVQLTGDGSGVYNQQPSWSNNSMTIVFHSNRVSGDFDLWTVAASGGTPTLLTGNPASGDYDPSYAKNGNFVAYAGLTAPTPPAASLDKSGATVAQSATPIPAEFGLAQNFPNPFNPRTTIQFAVPVNARAVLGVYDVLGRRVAELVNGEIVPGYHRVTFDGSSLASGIYFYQMKAEGEDGRRFYEIRKLMLIK